MIRQPRFNPDHPDYVLECEEAMEFALNEVGDLAEANGWTPEAVDAAMLNLAENRYMSRKANEMTEAAMKLFSRGR